jgi:hypothetical protein
MINSVSHEYTEDLAYNKRSVNAVELSEQMNEWMNGVAYRIGIKRKKTSCKYLNEY